MSSRGSGKKTCDYQLKDLTEIECVLAAAAPGAKLSQKESQVFIRTSDNFI
jgi:hypothetical protein